MSFIPTKDESTFSGVPISCTLTAVLAIIGVDATGIGIVMPALPSLLREANQTTHIAMFYGTLMAIYATLQFLFAPLLGRLSDLYGRRPVLVCSLIGAALDYLATAAAPSLIMLSAGRIVAGATGANFAVATSVVVDVTRPSCRARRFGMMGAIAGVGLIVGPALGGLLSAVSLRAPYLFAAGLNAVGAAAAMWLLPETRVTSRPRPTLSLRTSLPSFAVFQTQAELPKLVGIYAVLVFAAQLPLSLWVLYGQSRFGWDARSTGLFLAFYGLLVAGTQFILVAPFIRWVGEHTCLVVSATANAVAFAALCGASKGWMAFVLLPLWCLGAAIFPVFQSMLSRTTSAENQGRLQGALASLASLISIPTPLLATLILTHSPPKLPGFVWLLTAVAYIVVIWILFRHRQSLIT